MEYMNFSVNNSYGSRKIEFTYLNEPLKMNVSLVF
jgi:hypothetical protein